MKVCLAALVLCNLSVLLLFKQLDMKHSRPSTTKEVNQASKVSQSKFGIGLHSSKLINLCRPSSRLNLGYLITEFR